MNGKLIWQRGWWGRLAAEPSDAWPEQASALADDTGYIYWADEGNGWIKRMDR
jgi:hypothetical protein